MTTTPNILLQIDSDPQPKSFDSITAIDAGVDHLLTYGNVTLAQVLPIVQGAIFSRSEQNLKHSAIFIGGQDVIAGQAILSRIIASFHPPHSVSVMLDPNAANTTAAAAIVAANKHLDLKQTHALVLGATGPVGIRLCKLLALAGANVKLASRSEQRAQRAAHQANLELGQNAITPVVTASDESLLEVANHKTNLLIASGAAGIELMPQDVLHKIQNLKVAIDLNAAPPAGIESINPLAAGQKINNLTTYGAIAIQAIQTKIQQAAIKSLFTNNNQILEAEEIFKIALELNI